jgi:hypothetical protein
MQILKSKTLFLFSFSILLISTSFAQEYLSGFYGGTGNEILNRICTSRDGGYLMAGNTDSYGPGSSPVTNAYVVRVAGNGTVEWSLAWGGSNYDDATDIRQTLDGGFIVCGWTESFGQFRLATLVKFDSTGHLAWSKIYSNFSGNIDANRVFEKLNGNFVIYGTVDTLNYSNVWIAETDPTGNILQSKMMYTGGDNYPGSIDTTADGSFLFCGSVNPLGYHHMILFKTDNQLNQEWFTYGGNTINNYDDAFAIKEISNGNIVIGGGSSANENFWGVYDYCLVKFDSAGNFLAARTYGQNQMYECGFDLAYNPATQKLFLAGEISDQSYLALTIVADTELTMMGPVHPGFGQISFNNVTKSIIQKPDGQLVIGGWSSETGSNDFFLALVDSNGAAMPGCDYQSFGPYVMNYPQMAFSVPGLQPMTPQNVIQYPIVMGTGSGVVHTPKCNTVAVPETDGQTLTVLNDYSSGEVEIIFPDANKNGIVILYDVYGRKLNEKKVSTAMHSTRFSIEKNGIYFAEFSGERFNEVVKIIF